MSDSVPDTGPSFGHRLHHTAGRRQSGQPAESPLPPVVPGLTVGRLLGRGGFSSVWLVTDDVGRRFALKIATLPAPGPGAGSAQPSTNSEVTVASGAHGRRARVDTVVSSAEAHAGRLEGDQAHEPAGAFDPRAGTVPGQFERELRLLQRFRHDHLLRVHRMVETDQGPGMLAELAPGGSLLALITSRGPLPISEVVTALAPIAQVVAYLHAEGATHGDVAPGNILFTSEGKPLLGDLGTGRLVGAAIGNSLGTPGFATAPTDGAYDIGVDIFALAAVCWFALTGRTPGPTEQRPPLVLIVPEVTPALMEIIEDALSETVDRCPTADEFARVLLASATPSPVNLVPAVHESVLPELLTRRVADRGTANGARGTYSARRRSERSGAHPRTRYPSRDPATRAARTGHRLRRGVALLGAALATVLLGVGALTVGGTGEPAAQDPGADGGGAAVQRTGEVPPDTGRTEDGREEVAPSEVPREDGGAEGTSAAAGNRTAAVSLEEAFATARDGDPVVALTGLAALRAHAFTEADVEVLQAVDVGGSPAMVADLDAVGALADAGKTLDDFSITLRDPGLLTGTESADHPASRLPAVAAPPDGTAVALVTATAALSSYTEAPEAPEAAAAEAPSAPLMAAGLQELVFVLWNSGGGWRIHTVALSPD